MNNKADTPYSFPRHPSDMNVPPPGEVLPEADTKSSSSWWRDMPMVSLGGYEFNSEWARQALGMIALRMERTCIAQSHKGAGLIEYDDLKKRVIEELGGVLVYENLYNKTHNNFASWFVWNDGYMSCEFQDSEQTIRFEIIAIADELAQKLSDFARSVTGPIKFGGSVFALVSTSHGIQAHTVGMAGLDFEPTNYTKEVVEGYSYIVENLRAADPSGRMVILDGTPGTGKTYFFRSLMKEIPECRFVLIPSMMVRELAGPGLLGTLLGLKDENAPIILIVEDADECLTPRDEGNMSALATLLNITDGIFASTMNLFVLCSTNAAEYQIDEALKRPGRLMRKIHFDKLSHEHASEVYERLTKEKREFKEPTSVAEVYQLARDSGWKPIEKVEKRAVGFSKPARFSPDDYDAGNY